MTLISYSSFDSQIYGFLLYPDIPTSVEFRFLDRLKFDIAQVFTPLPDTYYYIFGDLIPFFKLETETTGLSFVSRPEQAFKLGSFSWIKTYTLQVDSEGLQTFTGVPYASEYLVYPLQTLKSAKIIMRYPDPILEDYVMHFHDSISVTDDVRTLDTRSINNAYGLTALTAVGAYLNLPDGMSATMKIFYSLRIYGYQKISMVGFFQPVLI